jgi:hypothetical protein
MVSFEMIQPHCDAADSSHGSRVTASPLATPPPPAARSGAARETNQHQPMTSPPCSQSAACDEIQGVTPSTWGCALATAGDPNHQRGEVLPTQLW